MTTEMEQKPQEIHKFTCKNTCLTILYWIGINPVHQNPIYNSISVKTMTHQTTHMLGVNLKPDNKMKQPKPHKVFLGKTNDKKSQLIFQTRKNIARIFESRKNNPKTIRKKIPKSRIWDQIASPGVKNKFGGKKIRWKLRVS